MKGNIPLLLNFSHPLNADHLHTLSELVGATIREVRHFRVHFDHNRSFAEQARALVDSTGLTPEQWQTTPLLVNLPSLNVIAAVVLAELHGRCGYFPAVLRLRPVEGSVAPRFEVAEIINLQAVRDAARNRRQS